MNSDTKDDIMDPMLQCTTLPSYLSFSQQKLDSYKDGDGDASFQLESDSLPYAHAQTTKTYYKHQDSRIMKAQELKTKTSANSDINNNSSEIKLRGRL
ncbi:hypothetical protein Tco_0223137 [Tanacetum coccineum]